jgi:hypothetical protein
MELKEVEPDKEPRLVLKGGAEFDLASFALYMRATHISRLSIRHRHLRHGLLDASKVITGNLTDSGRYDTSQPLTLSTEHTRLTTDAMRWVLQNDNFDAENLGKDLEKALEEIDQSSTTQTTNA